MKKNELNQVQKFKPLCILLMDSHLILSLKPTWSIHFLSQYKWMALSGAFGKSLILPRYYSRDIIKTRQASHGITETRQKGHWKNNVPRRGKRKIHTLWDRWTCANGKEWPWGTNEVLVIGLHMFGKMSIDLDLEASWNS